jgi:hypothetical protein
VAVAVAPLGEACSRRAATASQWRQRRRAQPEKNKACAALRPVAEAVAGPSDSVAQWREPAVFRGMCAGWAARRWDAERLCAAMNSVRASRSASGTFPRDGEVECPTEMMPTRAFLDAVRAGACGGAHLYCHGCPLPDALAADVPTPPLLRGLKVARRSLWISGAGASSPLHYDLPHVLMCQLQGRKRVHLYSPAHHDEMRPRAATFPALTAQERIARTARRDVKADGLVVELAAGDALLISQGWWHEVDSVCDDGALGCVSVGFNWPEIADSVGEFAQWKACTTYRTLSQGDVLERHVGREEARKMDCWSVPVF